MPTNYLNSVLWKEVEHLGENVEEPPQRLSADAFARHSPLKILTCHVVVPVMSLGRDSALGLVSWSTVRAVVGFRSPNSIGRLQPDSF